MDSEVLIFNMVVFATVVLFILICLKNRYSDPVKGCDLYKEEGCSHVDGYLCDYPDCSMLKRLQIKKGEN